MPELPRDDHELPVDPWTLEGLLGDERHDVDLAASGVSELAALVAAARTPAHHSELVGESAAVAAFIAVRDDGVSSTSTRHRRTSVLSTLIGSKLALAAAAGAVSLGGVSAAAFTGTLPDGAQALAHRVVGAPAAGDDVTAGDTDNDTDATDEATATATATGDATGDASQTSEPSATPVGPDATGPAAFGLCTAYTAQLRSGHTPDRSSIAFRNLAAAAGGPDGIVTYCSTVMTSHATSHPTGSPTTHPTKAPATHPTGSPTTHRGSSDPSHASDRTRPTGSPTTHPGR